MSPLVVGFLWFLTAFWAFAATVYLIDANANVRRLEALRINVLERKRYWQKSQVEWCKRAKHWREMWLAEKGLLDERAEKDCYMLHAELYGEKKNA